MIGVTSGEKLRLRPWGFFIFKPFGFWLSVCVRTQPERAPEVPGGWIAQFLFALEIAAVHQVVKMAVCELVTHDCVASEKSRTTQAVLTGI